MIRITNNIDGKLYELAPAEKGCRECAFDSGFACTIPKEYKYHHGNLACLMYQGIWKEIKDEN